VRAQHTCSSTIHVLSASMTAASFLLLVCARFACSALSLHPYVLLCSTSSPNARTAGAIWFELCTAGRGGNVERCSAAAAAGSAGSNGDLLVAMAAASSLATRRQVDLLCKICDPILHFRRLVLRLMPLPLTARVLRLLFLRLGFLARLHIAFGAVVRVRSLQLALWTQRPEYPCLCTRWPTARPSSHELHQYGSWRGACVHACEVQPWR